MKGRKSVKELLSEAGYPIDKVLSSIYGSRTPQEAVERIVKMTGGKFSPAPMTMTKLVERENPKNKEDFPFVYNAKESSGTKGRVSSFDLIEKKLGRSFWDIVREECPKGSCAEGVIWKLKELSDIEINAPTLLRYVSQGIDDGKVRPEDYFFSWIKKRDKKVTEDGASIVKDEGYTFTYTCRECGASYRSKLLKEDCFGEDIGLALIAKRCPKCQKWGTLKATTTIDGVTIIKAVVEYPILRCNLESFVDEEMKRIDNPLTAASRRELNGIEEYTLKKAQRDRQAKERYQAERGHDHDQKKSSDRQKTVRNKDRDEEELVSVGVEEESAPKKTDQDSEVVESEQVLNEESEGSDE